MKKNFKTAISIAAMLTMTISLFGCGEEPQANQFAQEDVPQLEGYSLLWNDEFNGNELNMDIWNDEPHEPGWTNNELQE